jgi:heme/copper-type cytochrome/quinol oxidase subunit 1
MFVNQRLLNRRKLMVASPALSYARSHGGSTRRYSLAGDNPWQATGLEWQTTSPPPSHNFHETPVVISEPYDYGKQREVSSSLP